MSEGSRSAPGQSGSGLRIRNPQDFWGGLTLVGLALFALWASSNLPGTHGFAFGPGTAPRLFAGCILVLAGAIAISGLFTDGQPVGKFYIRGPIVVMISIMLFAAMVRPMGLVITTFVSFMVAASASRETRWMEVTIVAVAFTIGCVLLFVYALNLPFQIWPRF